MAEFLKVKSSDEVLEIVTGFEPLGLEVVELRSALGRIIAQPVKAPEAVPHFKRALMDGFAVRARDTFGASESMPALLQIGGAVGMGETAKVKVDPGIAVGVPTGGMVPEGADAVVMVEYTSALDSETIEVTRPVAPGDNVLMVGEDIQQGADLFSSGHQLRPHDMGALAALGIEEVTVYRRPLVAIFSTGDEIIPVSSLTLPPGNIRDINSYSLAAQVTESGGFVGITGVVADNLDSLVEACRRALEDHDVVIVSGGSSVGARDFTVSILNFLPDSDLLVHGVAIRPGKPTILARVGEKILWGLPGHPVSAMMICRAFVTPCLRRLQGAARTGSSRERAMVINAVLGRQLPSVHGRTDYVPVVISETGEGTVAIPLFGKSAMISTLTKSDGYVIIPEHVEGLDEGASVIVNIF